MKVSLMDDPKIKFFKGPGQSKTCQATAVKIVKKNNTNNIVIKKCSSNPPTPDESDLEFYSSLPFSESTNKSVFF